MDVKTIQDKLALNREKLRIANSNGDFKKKQKIQNQISILVDVSSWE